MMALPAAAKDDRTDRSHLWVEFRVRGRHVAEVASRNGQVRWGPVIGVEFTYPAADLSGSEALFLPGRRGARLALHEGMSGELRVGRSRLAVEDLEAWGLVHGKGARRWVPLSREMEGEIRYRGVDLSFHFGPPPERQVQEGSGRVPLRFRRGFLAREEWPFAILAWCLYGLLLYLSLTLSSWELPEEAPPERVAQRFAKLIYEAPQAPTPARSELLQKAEEAEADPEEEPEPQEEEAVPETEPEAEPEVAQEEVPPEEPTPEKPPEPAVEEAPAPSPEPPDPGARREEIRRKVAKKGLLGLLGGRGAAAVNRTRSSILDGRGAAADLDQVLENVEGLRADAASGEGDGDGLGTAGEGLGGDIDEAARRAAGSGRRVVRLEEREEEAVEAVEEVELDDLTLQDAVAAIHKAVGTHLGGIRYLYNRELRKNPDLEGKLTVSITISPEGEVLECEVVDTTLDAPSLEEAVLKRIRTWRLPAVAPRVITVTYPFVFFPSM